MRGTLAKMAPLGLVVLLLVTELAAQNSRSSTPRRAKPPQFDPQTQDIFFSDVFSRVVGERPDGSAPPPVAPSPAATVTPSSPAPADPPASGSWSSLISATTIEDEVKAIKLIVDQEVATPGKFASQGYRVVRQQFSMLAVLFGIIAEYDGQVRWKQESPLARDRFSRAAANAKSGALQVFNEAKERKQDLQDLINGSRLEGQAEGDADWGRLVERPPLMQRLKVGFDERITPWTNSPNDFTAQREALVREAELVAVVSEILTKEGMDDAGDETYDGYARQMQQAAREIVEAARQNDHTQARAAAGEITKACSQCHELYR